MCHARDTILVCLDHRIPVLWKRDVSTLGLYKSYQFQPPKWSQKEVSVLELSKSKSSVQREVSC